MESMIVEALSVASFAQMLADLDHETRAIVTATENGEPWAHVSITPMTDTVRSVFPVHASGAIGDTRKVGQCGVMVRGESSRGHLVTVVERARRMARADNKQLMSN